MKNGLMLGLLLVIGCGTTLYKLEEPSGSVPAAEGMIKVQRGGEGDRRVAVRVARLRPAAAVSPGAQRYVVWLRPEGSTDVQRLGALEVDAKGTGKLEADVAPQRFELFVTAEPTPDAGHPTGDRLLWSNLGRRVALGMPAASTSATEGKVR